MRVAPLLVSLVTASLLSGCLFILPIPSDGPARQPEVAVQVDGRALTVRRSAETFPSLAPVNALTAEGIAITPDQPIPVRGQGEPAVVVGGTVLGEFAIAGRAVLAACGLAEGAPGFDPARATYDADAAEALFPVASCPNLDAVATPG